MLHIGVSEGMRAYQTGEFQDGIGYVHKKHYVEIVTASDEEDSGESEYAAVVVVSGSSGLLNSH